MSFTLFSLAVILATICSIQSVQKVMHENVNRDTLKVVYILQNQSPD